MRHSRKTGDCSRKRRLYGSPARIRWYAARRAERFARRFGRHWHSDGKAPEEGRNPAMTTIQQPRQAAPTVKGRQDGRCSSQPGKTTTTSTTASPRSDTGAARSSASRVLVKLYRATNKPETVSSTPSTLAGLGKRRPYIIGKAIAFSLPNANFPRCIDGPIICYGIGTMKIGDVSRQRRFADPARQRWYAHHRAVRFAFHITGSRPEQVSFPEPMSRVKEDDTELYHQEAGTGPEPLVQVHGCDHSMFSWRP